MVATAYSASAVPATATEDDDAVVVLPREHTGCSIPTPPVLALDDVCPLCGHFGPGMGMVGGEMPDGTQVHEICTLCEERAIVSTIRRVVGGRRAA